jgi:hypothetical protein
MINPAHYKVKVKGVEKPVTLAFSETYDPLWVGNCVDCHCEEAQVTKQSAFLKKITTLTSFARNDKMCDEIGSFPLYSFINGFTIEEDGQYEIFYSPQKYVFPGLIASGLTTVCLIGLILFMKETKNE